MAGGALGIPFWHRLQFGFTATYHYVYPQLTMGLALLILVMKTLSLRRGGQDWNESARFWIRIFGINFTLGVVTGIPLEFQFGTNWGLFSRYAGNLVGHTLGMEGLFAFFLESSFLAVLVWGEPRVGRIGHWLASLALFVGSWLSGYFIVATNAFLQRPVGHAVGPGGNLILADFGAFVLNPWALAEYAHVMIGSVVTGSFVVAAVGAFYQLRGLHLSHARRFLRLGVVAGLLSSLAVAFPTGDRQARLVARYQPVALAAMEGRFESGPYARITLIGQPNVAEHRIDNPLQVPGMLSFLAFGTFHTRVPGLAAFPTDTWPDNIELLYYCFHIMVGLGTLFIAVMFVAAILLARGRLERHRAALWVLMLAFPFPYIANAAGWLTAELGRQPWVVYGLLRTNLAASPLVHPGSALFTLIGFAGLYFVLGLLYLFLILREIDHGPATSGRDPHAPTGAARLGHV
jgi:cytochrome d ubiquinol oxidase subunit I